jgi:rod shape-determining protein MreD
VIKAARVFVSIVALLIGIVLQTSALPLLGLPGPSPQIVLVVVASIALCRGRATGMLIGFAGGLLLDIAPPADHPMGRFALAYCLAGYAVGAMRGEGQRSAFLPMVLVGVGVVIGNVSDALLGTVFGYVHLSIGEIVTGVPLAVLYDVVLTPFVFPVVAALDKRIVAYRHAPL